MPREKVYQDIIKKEDLYMVGFYYAHSFKALGFTNMKDAIEFINTDEKARKLCHDILTWIANKIKPKNNEFVQFFYSPDTKVRIVQFKKHIKETQKKQRELKRDEIIQSQIKAAVNEKLTEITQSLQHKNDRKTKKGKRHRDSSSSEDEKPKKVSDKKNKDNRKKKRDSDSSEDEPKRNKTSEKKSEDEPKEMSDSSDISDIETDSDIDIACKKTHKNNKYSETPEEIIKHKIDKLVHTVEEKELAIKKLRKDLKTKESQYDDLITAVKQAGYRYKDGKLKKR